MGLAVNGISLNFNYILRNFTWLLKFFLCLPYCSIVEQDNLQMETFHIDPKNTCFKLENNSASLKNIEICWFSIVFFVSYKKSFQIGDKFFSFSFKKKLIKLSDLYAIELCGQLVKICLGNKECRVFQPISKLTFKYHGMAWHVTYDIWYTTCDMWHVTCDMGNMVGVENSPKIPAAPLLRFETGIDNVLKILN